MKMKHIKLFEEFNEDPVYKLDTIIQGLVKTISSWFTSGLLAKNGLGLISIEPSAMTDILEKNIIFDFTDPDRLWMYQAILMIPLKGEDGKLAEEIKIANLLLKKYSNVDSNPADSIKGNFVDQIDKKISDVKGEFESLNSEDNPDEGCKGETLILDLITQMVDKPQSPGSTGYINPPVQK